jgi:hypothetical protein
MAVSRDAIESKSNPVSAGRPKLVVTTKEEMFLSYIQSRLHILPNERRRTIQRNDSRTKPTEAACSSALRHRQTTDGELVDLGAVSFFNMLRSRR